MKNYTIDEIVRRSLNLHGLTMHYYMDFLNIALQGARKINLESLPNVTATKLTIASDNTVALPADCIDVLAVGVENGDKVRFIGKDNNLNDRDNSGQPFGDADATGYESSTFQSYFYSNYFNKYGDFLGKHYGVGVQWSDSYRVIRSQGVIRIDQNTEAAEVYVAYVAEPEVSSSKTLVHPYAEQVLIDWIAWQYAKYKGTNRFDPLNKRRDFYNSYRILRSKRWGLTVTDLKRAFRKRYKMSPKN